MASTRSTTGPASVDSSPAGHPSAADRAAGDRAVPAPAEGTDEQATAALGAPTDPELLAELPTFEQFFKTFGFKRMQGRVWGLLVLSTRALSCREICDTLEISQGAASTTLTELNEWGAITSTFDSTRRCHLHAPVGNALQIAATILRRREQVAFQSFRQTIGRALELITRKHGERDPRVLTLRSIISACDIADAMMKLLVGAVANALGDGQSILSRAITAAFKVGLGEPGKLLTQAGPRAFDAPVVSTDELESEPDGPAHTEGPGGSTGTEEPR